jgi:hypothetical protein
MGGIQNEKPEMKRAAQIPRSSEKNGMASAITHERKIIKATTAYQVIQPLRVLMNRVIEFL